MFPKNCIFNKNDFFIKNKDSQTIFFVACQIIIFEDNWKHEPEKPSHCECVYLFSSLISHVEKKSKHGNLPFSRIFCSKKVIVFHDKKMGLKTWAIPFQGFVEKYL